MKNNEKVKTEIKNFPLKKIYFYLTEGCNLACRHCWINPKHQTADKTFPSLSFDLFKSIIEQAKPLGLTGVKLTGGEPLLHPQIDEILDFLQGQDLSVNIETNGVLCTPELAQKIFKCKKSFVAVSLDGSNAQIHEWVRGVTGCFEAAINGIQNLVNAGFRPQIIMTVMRHNKEQIEDLVQLAKLLGAGSVKFNIVQPTGRGEKMNDLGETLSVEEHLELGKWVEDELSTSTGLKLYYHQAPVFRSLGKMFGREGDGCMICGIRSIIGILSNGFYALCGIGSHIPELVFGDAAIDRLEDVWKNNQILLELREGIPHSFKGICASCLMKHICLASCIAQNYYTGKNLWAPFWFCEEAYKIGRFPETRRYTKTQL